MNASSTIITIFIVGYLAIAFEQWVKINKAAIALITGILCWTIYILSQPDTHTVVGLLERNFSEISGILFFLLGAMVIVELIDAHGGFDVITNRIRITNKRQLLWLLSVITFFLSAVLDNLTTTIVMVSLIRKLIPERDDRLFFVGMAVIAANAGGAWSPIGDVTTTMLWIGGQITALNIVFALFTPSFVCMLIPLIIATRRFKKNAVTDVSSLALESAPAGRNLVFALGLGVLIFVPIFKATTHLPPFMGMLLGLGVLWTVTELIHGKVEDDARLELSVNEAIRRIDSPSILFFLGILLAVSALQAIGALGSLATWLETSFGDIEIIGLIIGFMSAVVDNVPLVAATQRMYDLSTHPSDTFIWEYLAYCTGTGGSTLIIGSAAGVAAMGLEKIDFIWYIKRISLLATLGYLSGALVYIIQSRIVGGF